MKLIIFFLNHLSRPGAIILASTTLICLFFNTLCISQNLQTFTYDPSGNLQQKLSTNAQSSAKLNAPNTLCPGDSATLRVEGGSGYRWSGGQQGSSIRVAPSSSTLYRVTVTTGAQCETVLSHNLQVQSSLDLGTIQGVAPSDTAPGVVPYQVNNFPGLNYNWQVQGGAILKGQGASQIEVRWDGTGQRSIRVSAESSEGCRTNEITRSFQGGSSGNGTDTQTIPVQTGWNMVSTRLTPNSIPVSGAFANLIQNNNLEQVKSLTKNYQYGLDDAFNTLKNVSDGEGYWVKVKQAGVWQVTGTALAARTPISLQAGWNLVAYFPSSPMSVESALASVLSKTQKVKNSFAAYDPSLPAPFNTLKQMEPGQGYWIKVSEPTTLIYPTANEVLRSSQAAAFSVAELKKLNIYPNSMTAVGEVSWYGQPIEPGLWIEAWVGGECRGIGRTASYADKTIVPLVLNGVQADRVQFRLYRHNQLYTSDYELQLQPGAEAPGFLPLEFPGRTPTLANAQRMVLYPNPSTTELNVRYTTTQAMQVQFSLYSLAGKLCHRYPALAITSAGEQITHLPLQALDLATGMYLLKLDTPEGASWATLIHQSEH